MFKENSLIGKETARFILEQAPQYPFGLALQYSCRDDAEKDRRRLYNFRARMRKTGNFKFDCLSILIKQDSQLWVVKRESNFSDPELKFLEYRQLNTKDMETLPPINSRGRCKFSSLPDII